ncbi:DMT family transporter, partial [Akkermansiaceae bacterium]|nr:DMT family transporter [Akkermansiaceae bacterium]
VHELDLVPSFMDWAYLFLLGGLCTVVAFSEYVNLLKRFSVFTINFMNNLEPVYGILLAAIILKDYQHLGPGFYVGASVIVVAISLYPLVRRRFSTTEASYNPEAR